MTDRISDKSSHLSLHSKNFGDTKSHRFRNVAEKNQISISRGSKLQLDSILETGYDTNGTSVIYTDKYEFLYNSNGIWSDYFEYEWNSSSKEWEMYEKASSTYDANNRVKQQKYYEWNISFETWVVSYKIDETYDGNGNNIQTNNQYLDGSEFRYWKYIRVFDANNNLITETSYDKDNTTGNWDETWKSTYTYDANKNMTEEISYSWNKTSASWEISNKYSFTYNAINKLTEELYYYWDGSMWVQTWKNTYTYDANNRLISDISYSWDGTSWIPSYKTAYTLDANGNGIKEEWLEWDNINMKWIPQSKGSKRERTFDLSVLMKDINMPNDLLFDDEDFIFNKIDEERDYNDKNVLDYKDNYYYSLAGASDPNVEICMVALDSLTQKNMVIWERKKGFSTASYNIYRESTTAGVYTKIGTRPFDSLSVFIDYNSDPRKQAYRYKISAVDNLGKESIISPPHTTMHLKIVKGTSNETHLIWTPYEGKACNTYYIYRGPNTKNIQLIDSIQSTLTSYSDYTAPPQTVQFYFVSAKFLDACYPAITRAQANSGPYSQSVSNIRDYSTTTAPYIQIAPVLQIAKSKKDTLVFEVWSSLKEYTASSDQSWATTYVDTANKRIFVYVDMNSASGLRMANITVSGQGITNQMLNIVQNGTFTAIAPTSEKADLQVYPNPFNGSTNISFSLDKQANVDVSVYSLTGQKVSMLHSGTTSAGDYNYQFNPAKNGVNLGLYLLIVRIDNQQTVRKLVEIK
jgi:hypothetical protein